MGCWLGLLVRSGLGVALDGHLGACACVCCLEDHRVATLADLLTQPILFVAHVHRGTAPATEEPTEESAAA